MANKIRVGITQGDSAGVGWEVIFGALADTRMNDLATFVVYGSRAAANVYNKASENSAAAVQIHTVKSAGKVAGRGINLVNTDDGTPEAFEPGVPTAATGTTAVKALKLAAADLKSDAIDVLVTAPISKENSQGAEFKHAGHTEFLAAEFEGQPVMMMCGERLRVALVTAHMALADVPGAISKEKIVDKLRTLRKTLVQDFAVIAPRIAVLALNPHAGENGMMGTDEAEVVAPAVREAWAEGILAFGPFAADGLFLSGEYPKYDVILAMYHDQGLAPFKALAPDGVNYTAGLSVVRTSPDHGTAFDIAGKGTARPDSMRNAIYAAIDIHRARTAHTEASRNPLKHYERERGDERTIDLSETEL
ncbi:MAG: 4-hydroxythreonine-4-phosphate dehydrogenase PdxA [Alistipes sp.]|nr:4-hydroxythreonine-4-phosphate dehydrogenase PdxA [Alistipes sp.]